MQRHARHYGGRFALACAFIVCLGAATSLSAQRRGPARRPATPPPGQVKPPAVVTPIPPVQDVQLEPLTSDPSVEGADVAITAIVRANSLLFEAVPNPKVEFPGQPQRDTVWEAQRENLPTPVEPGVTYRNIGIRLKITSVFHDIDRIVAEALGEIPVSDNKSTETEPAKKPAAPQKSEPTSPPAIPVTPPPKERR